MEKGKKLNEKSLKKINLSSNMMEKLQKEEAIQIKGGKKKETEFNVVCHTDNLNVPCNKKN